MNNPRDHDSTWAGLVEDLERAAGHPAADGPAAGSVTLSSPRATLTVDGRDRSGDMTLAGHASEIDSCSVKPTRRVAAAALLGAQADLPLHTATPEALYRALTSATSEKEGR